MSTGPIVTIGGQEVYYPGRPQPPQGSGSPTLEIGLMPPLEAPPRDQRVNWLFALALAAGVLVVITAIMTRHTRRCSRSECCAGKT